MMVPYVVPLLILPPSSRRNNIAKLHKTSHSNANCRGVFLSLHCSRKKFSEIVTWYNFTSYGDARNPFKDCGSAKIWCLHMQFRFRERTIHFMTRTLGMVAAFGKSVFYCAKYHLEKKTAIFSSYRSSSVYNTKLKKKTFLKKKT